MIPIVNHKHKFILLYSAKAGCSSLRRLYLNIHEDEFTEEQAASLDKYHNLNELFFYDPTVNHRGYHTCLITRNPYNRIVSAYLDQYVYYRGRTVKTMLADYSAGSDPDNFLEFLECLKRVPDEERDSHFQTQSYFGHAPMVVTPKSIRYRLLKQKPPHAFGVSQVADISAFDQAMKKLYNKVFRFKWRKKSQVDQQILKLKKSNSSFYGTENYEDAAKLPVSELDQLVFAPKPQDFLVNPDVVKLIGEIYHVDFDLFEYDKARIPSKEASKEIALVPQDFDWQMYLRLNPDLHLRPDEFYNERTVVRHYLEFGRHEQHLRAYKMEAPEGFNWQRYLELNGDLPRAGIKTEEAAIEHYLGYGVREYRKTQ